MWRILLLVTALFLSADPQKILLITLPKSGTHLLRKAVRLITQQSSHWTGLQNKRFNPERDLHAPHSITAAHLFPIMDQIRNGYLDRYAAVLLIRDPRDIMLSFTSHLRRALTWAPCPTFDHQRYLLLTPSQQLQETLAFPEQFLNPAICFPYVSLWMSAPSVLVCRFEDLVGSKGGGSDEVQIATLTTLANHIGYPCTPEQIQAIADQLFGNTWTFDKGQIGRWKETYTQENLELFNFLYGNYPAQWGYLY